MSTKVTCQNYSPYTNILVRWNVLTYVVERDNRAIGRDIWKTDKVFSLSCPFKIDNTNRYTVPVTIQWMEGEGPSNTDERISLQQSTIQTVFPPETNTLCSWKKQAAAL